MGNLRTLGLAGALLAALPAGAVEFNYEVGAAYGHSDNVRRTQDGEQSEDIAAATLKFSVDQRTRHVRADLVGDLAWNEYLNDSYDSELIGNFAGAATFGLLPDRIEWFVGDNFGQVLSDPFIPATPENSENINQFSTGPNFIAAFGSQMRLQLTARYINTDFEDLPFDSQSYRGELALIRLLSERSAISINLRNEDVTLDEELLQADYKNIELFLRYEAAGARTNVHLDLGASQMDREAAADKEDGLVLRTEISRRLSASSLARLSAGREFANSGSSFAGSLATSGVNLTTAPGRQSAQPFISDYASLRWNFDRNRTGLGLYGTWSERTYEDLPSFNQTLTTLGGALRRDLTASTAVTLDASTTRGKFAQSGGEYDELNAGLSFNWQLSRYLTLAFSYDFNDRDNGSPVGSYQENRLWLSLGFGSGRPRTTFAPPTFGVEPTP